MKTFKEFTKVKMVKRITDKMAALNALRGKIAIRTANKTGVIDQHIKDTAEIHDKIQHKGPSN